MPLRSLTSGFVEGTPFPIQIKIHPRARGLTLRYDAKHARFNLTRPKRISASFIQEFLQANQNWMEKQVRIAPTHQTLQPGATMMIEGYNYTMVHRDAAGVAVQLTTDELIISCRSQRFSRALQRWIKQRAADIMTPLVYDKAAQLGKPVKDISYRDTKSRWGSCAHDGRLSFSWRLIMAPMEVIDYLVAHEVAHLAHMNHSQRFWTCCHSLTPHTTFAKHWLKTNGAALHHIEF